MAKLDQLLVWLAAHGGSDLHLAAGLEPRVRLRGTLEAAPSWTKQSNDDLLKLMREIAEDRHWTAYERDQDVDFAYGVAGIARFRVNYFVQENGAAAVFRLIPETIVPLAHLHVPAAVEGFAHLNQGLVLVTGPTGSGKSTTLASILDAVNDTYAKHIVTIEDPIEFVHTSKKSAFSQREVGRHTETFAQALRSALREDADVILVGELRDRETIELALTAAEMGMLVFATLHTNGAAKTIDRLIDSFPPDEQPQIRMNLSESLAGVISQLLIKRADGQGRHAACEILVKTSGLPNIIRENNISMLQSMIQAGRGLGMQTMDEALMELVRSGAILAEDAYLKATDKRRFEALLPKDELDIEVSEPA
jgi:twitching motility protein PilT